MVNLDSFNVQKYRIYLENLMFNEKSNKKSQILWWYNKLLYLCT